jgi:hypothetical protein
MDTATDRRAPGAERIPFDGLVEVGGAMGPTFEAQAIDLSRDGIGLQAAYLPEIGQPLSCRFESGTSEVICEAEVAWKQEAARGGGFGIRFTNLDESSEEALSRLLLEEQLRQRGPSPVPENGAKLRLHIEGLGAPMRARVKNANDVQLNAHSDLSFLKLGKEIDLEDATTGERRAARIDDVGLEVNPQTNIPQLVVSLSYGEGLESRPARSKTLPGLDPKASVQAKAEGDSEDAPVDNAARMKGAMAAGFSKVSPALMGLTGKAKGIGISLFSKFGKSSDSAKASSGDSKKGDSLAPTVKRTTAPPPAGALSSSGRKIHRVEGNEMLLEKPAGTESPMELARKHKRKLAIGGAAVLAVGLLGFAMRKSDPPAANTTTASIAAETTATAPALAAAPALSGAKPLAVGAVAGAAAPGAAPVGDVPGAIGDPTEGAGAPGADGKLVPFTHGTVTNGNVLHLKMDGKIDRLQGAAQPTGFTVVLPKRRGVEAAAALLRKDPRIAEVHLNNQPTGAEISMTFKDGVPAYIIRAKGDTLEMILGRPGADAADAKNAKHEPAHKKPGAHGHAVEPASHHARPHH